MLTTQRRDLEREAELRAYAVLDAEDFPALERIADLAARICGMAVSEVNVVTTTDVVHVATTNRDHLRVPREFSFCSPIIEREGAAHVVEDATAQEPFASSPYVTGEKAAIRSYASAQLVGRSGNVLGTLCVFDEAHRQVDAGQLVALQGLAAMVMDLLELRRDQLELAGTLRRVTESHRELHDSNDSLEAFAGQISHDLQQPLAAVELALEILADEAEVGDDARMLIEHARAGNRRMSRTITDLLDFAVAGRGSPAVPVDLDEVLVDVLADLRTGLDEAKVEVQPLPRVLGHPSEVRAVLQNLVANAVKFTSPHGVPEVQVSGEVVGTTARIVVADNGPGIPEDERSAVFELAFRGRSDVEGHGIGLATCARIVRTRGGRIGVEQADSGGAAFWFELPAG